MNIGTRSATHSSTGAGDLSVHDLADVVDAVHTAMHKWRAIGLQLRVPEDTLEGIQVQHTKPADCLREMLQQWLVHLWTPPTWSSLVQALSSGVVGEMGLAEVIRMRYCHQDGQQAASPAPGAGHVQEEGRNG